MGFIAKRFEPDPMVLRNSLRHWFRFDHLEAEDGIALLIGIEPLKGLFEGQLDEFDLIFGISFLNGDCIGLDLEQSDDPEIGEYEYSSDEERAVAVERGRARFQPYLNTHCRFMAYWESGTHPARTPLSHFVEWAISKGIAPAWLPVAHEIGLIGPADKYQCDVKIADRAHVSEKLAFLNQAAQRFWANANPNDRSTHPTNSDVVEWLVQHGYTQTLAEKAATIIRPDWAPTGRKPEE